ncbi:MAG: hypothetical protein K8F36_02855 [Melioribacteraceae bacterium]|nr:hypothetical protein [Melioribacteraceae bacterium]
MKKISFISLFLILVVSIYPQEAVVADSFYLASWNLENLFDTEDDPAIDDEEFLPSSRRQWNEHKLSQKIENLKKVIEFMNNQNGPDVLGVQEVENFEILERLKNRLDVDYGIAYAESPDNRGIDNGLLYNKEKFEYVSHQGLDVRLPDDWPTRLILEVQLKHISGEEFFIFVNHWPSRSGGFERSEPNRIAAAQTLKNRVDELLLTDENTNIIILGDLNDEPNNVSVVEELEAADLFCGEELDRSFKLFNLATEVFLRGEGTYLYRGDWNMLDQVIVSRGLLDSKNFDFVCGSFEIIKPEFIVTKEGNYKGASIPTFGGRSYLGGYSDHFSVGAKFKIIK